jgi:hypothetical protein
MYEESRVNSGPKSKTGQGKIQNPPSLIIIDILIQQALQLSLGPGSPGIWRYKSTPDLMHKLQVGR